VCSSQKFWTVYPKGVVQDVVSDTFAALKTGFGTRARLIEPVSVAFSKPRRNEKSASPGKELISVNTPDARKN
jgi:hypothetical protein